MTVGKQGAESTIDNALSMASAYWLAPQVAVDEARKVAQVVESWQNHFAAKGLGAMDLDALSTHIDRPFLLKQRQALLQ
jgi:serine/threonine-protein kinase HipA